MMGDLTIIQKIAVWALPILFAITVHEWAHGFVAYKLGDPTAKMLGRLSLNPIKHIDPIGTVVVPLVLMVLGGFIFGWAKPVPITPKNLHNPKNDMAYVAAAGPLANFIMAILWALVIHLGYMMSHIYPDAMRFLVLTGVAGIQINLILMVLNLLPVPPLDGSRILTRFLPADMAYQYNRLEPYGFFILLALLALGWLNFILGPAYEWMLSLVLQLTQLK